MNELSLSFIAVVVADSFCHCGAVFKWRIPLKALL